MTTTRIDWVVGSCRLLAATADEIERTRPFAGLVLGASIHLEPKTAAMLTTLQRGGAEVVATGNLSSTQPATVAWLRERGIEVVGERTTDAARHGTFLDAVVERRPALLLDNGGDLFARFAERPWDGLLGGTEETTSGRMRLVPLRERIGRPVLVINDSPIKQFAENRHGVGQSVFESFLRITNRVTNGRARDRVRLRRLRARRRGVLPQRVRGVSVVDADPVTTLEAHLDGFLTPPRDEALASADVVVDRHRGARRRHRRRPAAAARRRHPAQRGALPVGDRRRGHRGLRRARGRAGDVARTRSRRGGCATAARCTC